MSKLRTVLGAIPLAALALIGSPQAAPDPASVTLVGSLQSEIGCAGDWDPACAATHLAYDASDDVWQRTFTVPGGSWEYKAALNDSWDENYGLHAVPGGANVPLVTAGGPVKFYYDDKTHWVTDNVNSVIAVAPGSFQSELGCPDDWQPDCLRSWLEDPDGDGTYTFETTALPAGSYEAKVALDESWDVNYGQGGVPGGANIPFTVATAMQRVTFSWDSTTHDMSILLGPPVGPSDNNVEWDGLRHDSRDLLYRTPGGAVPAGTPVKLRFRTFHDDVTSVKARIWDVNLGAQRIVSMERVASDVSCYQPGLAKTCDFWQTEVPGGQPDNLWYRFIVADGTKTVYYADDTPALDGGLGAPSDTQTDQSWALTVYDPGFVAPDWAKDAVVYQIFPDRFRDGSDGNDAVPGPEKKNKAQWSKDPRYAYPNGDPTVAGQTKATTASWDRIVELPWNGLPEGSCRNYAGATTATCPKRFPQPASPALEQPRGRDYYGGDLKGVEQKLDYLRSLGVTALYFNPIFDAGSNHGYDTQDYYKIDPYFGTNGDFKDLAKKAEKKGIRIILDGVFNHMSSDSPFFDRYGNFKDKKKPGACESASSQWRGWFTFRAPVGSEPAPCAPSPGGSDTYYTGWFGFDSIPVLTKTLPAVQDYFVTGRDSVSRYWLKQGAEGWRLDVMGDSSFPDGYWESFRNVVKETDPNALIVGELWQKDSTLLRFLRGDRADTTMNYRLRDAVLGLLAPGPFDSKGFADSGNPIPPSAFASRIAAIQEDYPRAAAYSAMDLLGSHDTARLLWVLTPGAENRTDKESPANLAQGKQRLKLASLIQFTMPGAPTIYYGDEVGMTGADDPDDRRTYPWADEGGRPDEALLAHYKALAQLRRDVPAMRDGDLRILLADDAGGVVAYGRKSTRDAALVLVNRSDADRTGDIPVAGYLPDGFALTVRYGGSGTLTVSGGVVQGTVPARSAIVLAGSGDLEPPAAPAGLHVTGEGSHQVSLAWDAVAGAARYAVYRSPLSGGGWVKVGAPAGTTFTDTGLRNAERSYYVVRALDGPGNESGDSNEVSAVPRLTIGWANLQWPPTLTHTISAVNRTDTVYGQVWIDGETSQPGPTPSLTAQLGFGPHGSNPAGNAAWTWVDASFNVDAGSNDEFKASLLPEQTGSFDYVYRYSTTGGQEWLYADLNGPVPAGALPPNPGRLTVNASGDTTPPAMPTGLHVVSASPAAVELAWNPVVGDPTLYGYEVLRSETSGGPYKQILLVTSPSASDTEVAQGQTYYYVLRSVDTSFNRSGNTGEVSAKAELRTVTVMFGVTVPATTDGTGRAVNIAGFLDRLDPPGPQWDPGGKALTRVDATHWQITLTGKESTQIEYKYALGDWDHVEKDGSCGEISNRQLTLTYGASGTQTVNDTVPNWRNVAPCGN